MEHGAETATGTWNAPECPFQIEYSARMLDDIRLAVVDAFFSLPRGGAEIGGILLGKWDGDRISITAYEALDCEHAMGPSFTLSPRDQARLAEMMAHAGRNPDNRQPVGWYHSHTRSEIFLSETDQDIHKRFFPEPWQVALVLKPHTFEPTRGGFFFREPDGSIRGTASYQEFQVDPLPLRTQTASGNNRPAARRLREDSGVRNTLVAPPPASGAAGPAPAASGNTKGRVPITREIAIEPPFAEATGGQEPAAGATVVDPPDFGQMRQERSWRALKTAAILALGLAAGGVGYQTRQFWLPRVLVKARSVLPKDPDAVVSIAVSDDDGELKIRWDGDAPPVRSALDGTLEITDGNTVPQSVRLDGAHLATGAFTYGRENERVDVTLILSEPNGQFVKGQTSFLGKLPARKGTAEDPQDRKQRDSEAQKAEKLQKDSNFQAAKIRKLERDLKDMREQLQSQQKGRGDTHAPDPGKKD